MADEAGHDGLVKWFRTDRQLTAGEPLAFVTSASRPRRPQAVSIGALLPVTAESERAPSGIALRSHYSGSRP